MPRTLYDKLVDSHTVQRLDDEHVLLYADLHIMNEYTSPQAFAGLRQRGLPVRRPWQNVAVVDHIIPTHPLKHRVILDEASALQASNLARNCELHGIALFDTNDPLQGIEHVVAPELGMIRPGMVVLCGDSHTTTYGAFGALGFGIGTSEVEHVLATQTLVHRVAKNMRIRVDGQLGLGCTAKDLVLHIIASIGAQGARGYVVEFTGEGIAALSAEARMTICNMAVEAGARSALIEPDEVTIEYVAVRAIDMKWHLPRAMEQWRQLRSDRDARFHAQFHFDASEVSPRVTWGTSPDQSIPIDQRVPDPAAAMTPQQRDAARRALQYIGLEPGASLQGLTIDRVFIGSCTNARIEDLREVAKVVRGRKVDPRVRAMVVPGSGAVRDQAEVEGIAAQLIAAGFEWRQPGCSMCLAMNDDVLRPGERCASTTNRNFEGRQGRAGRTHLMSPAMAAAAAIHGCITDVRRLEQTRVQ
ncbi:3-isopropylmalate dehydratase large subunit [Steroidobacter flavus]|uniref:3-isopropylmalate dehydratase large subunit n=1 Tax=Steroidobacter flavus TaxID=1842136 RepID=A0ABV8SW85_9GAMM